MSCAISNTECKLHHQARISHSRESLFESDFSWVLRPLLHCGLEFFSLGLSLPLDKPLQLLCLNPSLCPGRIRKTCDLAGLRRLGEIRAPALCGRSGASIPGEILGGVEEVESLSI